MAATDPYTGVLGLRLAKHLLRRTTFNFSKARIDEFANLPATTAVDRLMNFAGFQYPEGPRDGNGHPWLTATPNNSGDFNGVSDRPMIRGWVNQELYFNPTAEAKVALWLHTCFMCDPATDGWENFEYWRLMFWGANHDLKRLAAKVTLDRVMLHYLDNRFNRKNSPNENYAREFLELFTIQRGPQIGVGNYTNYTEYDIQQAARLFTGFTVDGFENKDPETGLARGRARYNDHDTGDKTFSSAFGGRTISGAASEADMFRELDDFVDMVFDQMETARAFVRRAYRFFVSDNLDAAAESSVIEPLATQLHQSGYQVKPMIETLLKSRWFFDQDDSNPNDEVVGGKLKSDIDLRYQAMSFFQVPEQATVSPSNDPEEYYHRLWDRISSMGIGTPASVEGYPGFYKAPAYSKFWFSGASMVRRYEEVEDILDGRVDGYKRISDQGAQIDIVDFVRDNFTNQEDAQALVTQIVDYLLPETLDQDRFNYFYETFLGTLSPINWMFEWQGIMGGGDPASARNALRRLFDSLGSSPEYQIL